MLLQAAGGLPIMHWAFLITLHVFHVINLHLF